MAPKQDRIEYCVVKYIALIFKQELDAHLARSEKSNERGYPFVIFTLTVHKMIENKDNLFSLNLILRVCRYALGTSVFQYLVPADYCKVTTHKYSEISLYFFELWNSINFGYRVLTCTLRSVHTEDPFLKQSIDSNFILKPMLWVENLLMYMRFDIIHSIILNSPLDIDNILNVYLAKIY